MMRMMMKVICTCYSVEGDEDGAAAVADDAEYGDAGADAADDAEADAEYDGEEDEDEHENEEDAEDVKEESE
eukprot:1073407-Pyramimonas_sp.AAC.1